MTIGNSPPSASPISADASAQLPLVVADPGPINTFAELPPKPNYLICDRTGFKLPIAEGLRKEWTGYLVRKESLDRRHPQEFVRSRPERAKGSPRPEPDELFGTEPLFLIPPVPPYLSAQGVGAGQVQLFWTQSTYTYPNKVVSYNIYRRIGGGSFLLLANQLATVSRTYTDTGLVAGPIYSYYVTAVTSYSIESVPSNAVNASRTALLVTANDDAPFTGSVSKSATGAINSFSVVTTPDTVNNPAFITYSPDLDRLLVCTPFTNYNQSTSNAATSWTGQLFTGLNQPQNIVWAPRLGIFAAGTFAEFGTSSTGLTGSWTSRFGSRAANVTWVPWMNGGLGRFCFFAPNIGPGTFHYSDNGTSFTAATVTAGIGNMPTTYTDTAIVSRTFAGAVYSSPDGVTWTNVFAAGGKAIRGLMSNGTRIVSFGGADSDFQYSDNNGASWTNCTISAGSVNGFLCGTWSSALSKFVALEYVANGKIATSPDGITWAISTPTGSSHRPTSVVSVDTTNIAITV